MRRPRTPPTFHPPSPVHARLTAPLRTAPQPRDPVPAVPAALSALTGLTSLSLEDNYLASDDPWPAATATTLTRLRRLNLSHTYLNRVPEAIQVPPLLCSLSGACLEAGLRTAAFVLPRSRRSAAVTRPTGRLPHPPHRQHFTALRTLLLDGSYIGSDPLGDEGHRQGVPLALAALGELRDLRCAAVAGCCCRRCSATGCCCGPLLARLELRGHWFMLAFAAHPPMQHARHAGRDAA